MHPKALLDVCSELVRQVLLFEHPADAVVARFFRQHRNLGPRERQTLSETVYTVLRRKLLFDHFSPWGSGPKERRMAILGFQAPQAFLQGALTQSEQSWLERCQSINAADLLERHRHNLPDWLAQSLKDQLGETFWDLVKALDEPAGLDVRVNMLKAKRADVQSALALAGIRSSLTPFSPWGLRLEGKPNLSAVPAFVQGELEIQDEGSQLLALLLDAKRGEMVADFCAGAGGKTLAIGACMRNTGRLYAFDTSASRLDAFKSRIGRSGLSNVHPAAIAHERDDRIKRLSGKLDRVMVDAPCTGIGTLRRHPDLKWRQNLDVVGQMTAAQASILRSAARLVKSGGRLVYATCSLLTQENEAIAEEFSKEHLDFEPLAALEVLQSLKVPEAQALCSGGVGDAQFLRLWPHRHQTDGFFAAVWQRR